MNISAVLLAGGESRRMGTDKATLMFRGKPLWQHQLEILGKLGVEKIFVSARKDPLWRPNDIEFVSDASPSRGPLSGLVASVERIETPHLVALAVDVPFMTAVFLKSLLARVTSTCGAIPKIGDRFEPLAAIYPREAHVDLAAALEGCDFSLQSVARKLTENQKLVAVDVRENEREFFRNLNEPADLNYR